MKNLPEFKALIERYESVTIEEIEKAWYIDGFQTAELLTGFGKCSSCTLCDSVSHDGYGDPICKKCTWLTANGDMCNERNNNITYKNIRYSTSPPDLLTAFRASAAYMRQVLKDGGIE